MCTQHQAKRMVEVAHKYCMDATIDGKLGRDMLKEGVQAWATHANEEAETSHTPHHTTPHGTDNPPDMTHNRKVCA